ncbi:hypothetical protein BP5796_02624 [Coleophoma crateriformis]|uniref:GPI anchored cell wall protein n=1 Tax=Coleophoma crateriformis TaxID=565419 RepID=A0A3D8SYX5_9HELO|nr:hypothetical protein BP5796_02624 [Coleophoma crateriformis]
MYVSSSFVLAAVMALARVAVASPPACLIAAMGVQPNPADLTALCGTLESSVAGNITQLCSGSNEAAAVSIYSASCLAKGMTVTVDTTSSSSSSHDFKSGSGSVSATGSASRTAKTTDASAAASGTTASGKASAIGPSASTSATGSSGARANTLSQSAIIMGTLVLSVGFASYLL